MQSFKLKVYAKLQIEDMWQMVKKLISSPITLSIAGIFTLVEILNWLEVKPLTIICLSIFLYWFIKDHCNLRIKAPLEFERRLEYLCEGVAEIREFYPTMFYVLASGCLGALAVIGHLVSGSILVMTVLILAAILSTKYDFKMITLEDAAFEYDLSQYGHHSYEYDDEFMPDVNEDNLCFLERAGEVVHTTIPTDTEDDEDQSDEIPALLIPDLIPNTDESSTDDDQDDLLPTVPISNSETHVKDPNPTIETVVHYSKANDNIEFKKSHFKRDSSLSTSSSSEESLSKGLQFPDHTAVDGTAKSKNNASSPTVAGPMTSSQHEASNLPTMSLQSETQALLANSSNLIPTVMTSLVQGVLGIGPGALATHSGPVYDSTHDRIASALDSTDESDFEIVEEDDFE